MIIWVNFQNVIDKAEFVQQCWLFESYRMPYELLQSFYNVALTVKYKEILLVFQRQYFELTKQSRHIHGI